MNFSRYKNKTYSINELTGKKALSNLYGKDYKLQKEAYFALEKLKKEANRQGVNIRVISAYRNFSHQNRLWSRKYDQFINKGLSPKDAINKVKEYTSIPGTSRHHLGTDVDLSNQGSTKKSDYLNWMDNNAHKYGFYRVYTKNKLRNGYNYESWHYSYRKLAKPMLEQYIKRNVIKKLETRKVEGHQHFTVEFLNSYTETHILGINNYLY